MSGEKTNKTYKITKSDKKSKDIKKVVDKKKHVSSDDEDSSSVSSNDSCFDKESSGSNTMEETESEADSYISLTSTELLNNDPLYLVLSKFFVSKNGNNIADILEDLKKILK